MDEYVTMLHLSDSRSIIGLSFLFALKQSSVKCCFLPLFQMGVLYTCSSGLREQTEKPSRQHVGSERPFADLR